MIKLVCNLLSLFDQYVTVLTTEWQASKVVNVILVLFQNYFYFIFQVCLVNTFFEHGWW